jgi:hypothetical protein
LTHGKRKKKAAAAAAGNAVSGEGLVNLANFYKFLTELLR